MTTDYGSPGTTESTTRQSPPLTGGRTYRPGYGDDVVALFRRVIASCPTRKDSGVRYHWSVTRYVPGAITETLIVTVTPSPNSGYSAWPWAYVVVRRHDTVAAVQDSPGEGHVDLTFANNLAAAKARRLANGA